MKDGEDCPAFDPGYETTEELAEAEAQAQAQEDVLWVLAELDWHPLREDGVWELTERELRALIAEVERRTREAR